MDVQVGSDGSVTDAGDEAAKAVTFRNFYREKAINLFWEGPDGSTVMMGKITKGGAAEINTFVGHTFFATFDPEAKQRAVPSEVSIHTCQLHSF